jgi:hypothetical protein
MKKFVLFGVAAAALVAIPAAAQPQRGERVIDRAQIESRVGAMFARVDANRDGFITQAEADAARTAVRGQRMQQRGVRQGVRGERREAAFARLDTDRNGIISRAEFTAPRAQGEGRAERREARGERRAARFERRGERRGPRGAMGARFGAQAFARMDSDRDGRVSLAEATRFRLERFERMDANNDGRISREEVQAVRAERPAR